MVGRFEEAPVPTRLFAAFYHQAGVGGGLASSYRIFLSRSNKFDPTLPLGRSTYRLVKTEKIPSRFVPELLPSTEKTGGVRFADFDYYWHRDRLAATPARGVYPAGYGKISQFVGTAVGLPYWLELTALRHAVRHHNLNKAVTTVMTSDNPSRERIIQLLAVGIPAREPIALKRYFQGMVRGLKMALNGELAQARAKARVSIGLYQP